MKTLVPVSIIESKILFIRGQKVMLDRDLADLYGVETRVLNQAVRRNIDRFPRDFIFPLIRNEIMRISQFVISSKQSAVNTLKFSKSVMAFTEHGVAMLSSVLNSPRAVQVNIQIMRTFARIRKIMLQHRDLAKRLDELEKKYDSQSKVVFDAIRQLMTPQESKHKQVRQNIFFTRYIFHLFSNESIFTNPICFDSFLGVPNNTLIYSKTTLNS